MRRFTRSHAVYASGPKTASCPTRPPIAELVEGLSFFSKGTRRTIPSTRAGHSPRQLRMGWWGSKVQIGDIRSFYRAYTLPLMNSGDVLTQRASLDARKSSASAISSGSAGRSNGVGLLGAAPGGAMTPAERSVRVSPGNSDSTRTPRRASSRERPRANCSIARPGRTIASHRVHFTMPARRVPEAPQPARGPAHWTPCP